MSYYYELRKDSEAYAEVLAMDKMWEKWRDKDIEAEINQAIGFSTSGTALAMTGRSLMIRDMPAGFESHFKNSRNKFGYWEGKKKSPINQAFIEVCKKHGLITPDKWGPLHIKRGLGFVEGKKTLYTIGDRYFIKAKRELPQDTEEYLRRITEVEFLEIQLEHKKGEVNNDAKSTASNGES